MISVSYYEELYCTMLMAVQINNFFKTDGHCKIPVYTVKNNMMLTITNSEII